MSRGPFIEPHLIFSSTDESRRISYGSVPPDDYPLVHPESESLGLLEARVVGKPYSVRAAPTVEHISSRYGPCYRVAMTAESA